MFSPQPLGLSPLVRCWAHTPPFCFRAPISSVVLPHGKFSWWCIDLWSAGSCRRRRRCGCRCRCRGRLLGCFFRTIYRRATPQPTSRAPTRVHPRPPPGHDPTRFPSSRLVPSGFSCPAEPTPTGALWVHLRLRAVRVYRDVDGAQPHGGKAD